VAFFGAFGIPPGGCTRRGIYVGRPAEVAEVVDPVCVWMSVPDVVVDGGVAEPGA